MKKYYVTFKWRDFFEDEHCETKEFTSLHKATNFMTKIKRETKELVRRYTRIGVYNPYYDINLIESESK